jgi:DNA-binding NtrC family response regulator
VNETQRHAHRALPIRSLRVEVQAPDGPRQVVSGDVITVGTAPGNTLVLEDDTASRYHVELRRQDGRIEVIDHGSTNGTWIGGVELLKGRVPPKTILTVGKTKLLVDDGETFDVELHAEDRFHGLLGRSAQMRRLMASAERAGRSEVSVLILGETGTGKEVVARSIHAASKRSDKPLETVDCGSLLPTLVASELFGHEKGAFTGADEQRIGAFERADGGTIFLDEIGELPAALQATLLGVLERKSFRRVGGTKPVTVDVRVLAATNRDLREEVNKGGFRADLFYRLAVVSLQIPRLADRAEDLPILVEHFLREAGHQGDPEAIISPEVMVLLKRHRWPGNVRELRNFVDAALAMGEAPGFEGQGDGEGVELTIAGDRETYHRTKERVLHAFEGQYLRRLLDDSAGNVAKAARDAELDRSYLIQLLKKHGLR